MRATGRCLVDIGRWPALGSTLNSCNAVFDGAVLRPFLLLGILWLILAQLRIASDLAARTQVRGRPPGGGASVAKRDAGDPGVSLDNVCRPRIGALRARLQRLQAAIPSDQRVRASDRCWSPDLECGVPRAARAIGPRGLSAPMDCISLGSDLADRCLPMHFLCFAGSDFRCILRKLANIVDDASRFGRVLLPVRTGRIASST